MSAPRPMSHRLVAVGFIVLIVLGNIWYAFMVAGESTPAWLLDAAHLTAAIVLLGGFYMGARALCARCNR